MRDWGELEELCQACRGLPFLLSVRVRSVARSLFGVYFRGDPWSKPFVSNGNLFNSVGK